MTILSGGLGMASFSQSVEQETNDRTQKDSAIGNDRLKFRL